MSWGTIAWILIAIVAMLVMARGCGGMMGGGGCGMRRRKDTASKPEKPGSNKAAYSKKAT
jgi:hypothetical protein